MNELMFWQKLMYFEQKRLKIQESQVVYCEVINGNGVIRPVTSFPCY